MQRTTHTPKTTKTLETKAGPNALADLLYQALETELGGVEIYRAALRCVRNENLREQWERYLGESETRLKVMKEVCAAAGLDPDRDTPSRQVVRHVGKALVKKMLLARDAGDPEAAEIVAAECVVLAETKDHMSWGMIGEVAKKKSGAIPGVDTSKNAHDDFEDQEDAHLCTTSSGAARARQSRVRDL